MRSEIDLDNVRNYIMFETLDTFDQFEVVGSKILNHVVYGYPQAIEKIWTHGFCVITNTPLSLEKGTKPVAEKFGPIYIGPYGNSGYWELTSTGQPVNTSDASYTNIALNPHTDGTYFMVAPGYKLF